MPRNCRSVLIPLLCLGLSPLATARAEDPPLTSYFRSEVEQIAAEPLLGIDTLSQWQARRPELQRRLESMLGLDPMPDRTDLKVEVRGIVERPEFVVERLLFQSSPGLYVTANLYRPKEVIEPLPAVLYLCGHANVVRDGVIYGSKAHYQHHAAWYAANGYVCLLVDTLQLGEVPGLHHGTYREGKWWWQSLGYTPAGVEVWNGIRAIDYLQSRPEVDPDRIGVTGRSGGGAISWYLGAVDDRLAAVIPVAGITGMYDHLIEGGPTGSHSNGVIEGHCDCMYLVNTDRWEFDVLAALVAPKPMLVENTDRDPIFPESGVRRIYEQLEQVYGWYDASDRLGLVIGEGGHVDSEEIRHPSFAFMNTWLKGEPTDSGAIEEPDRKVPIEALKVLDPDEAIPADARNDAIDETFVPKAEIPPVPQSESEWQAMRDRWMETLQTEVFGGWPDEDEAVPLEVEVAFERPIPMSEWQVRAIDFTSQQGVRLRTYLVWPEQHEELKGSLNVLVAGADHWEVFAPWIDLLEGRGEVTMKDLTGAIVNADVPLDGAVRDHPVATTLTLTSNGGAFAIVVPRGLGPTSWEEGREDTHIRRRFALIGQTLDGMRVWDVRRALAAVSSSIEREQGEHDLQTSLGGWGDAAALALWAAVFEPDVGFVLMVDPPETVREGPVLLNLERVLDMPQAVALLHPRDVGVVMSDNPEAFDWAIELRDAIAPDWSLSVDSEDDAD